MNKNNQKKLKINNHGFTLVELMVAIALISILTGIILQVANFSETNKNLTLSKNEVQAAIRLTQSYSLSIPETGNKDICGFGFYVKDAETYAIYYTHDSDLTDQISCADSDLQKPDALTKELESGTLSDDVAFESVSTPADSYVFFQAPYGNVYNPGGFTIENTNNPIATKSITVTSNGKID